MGIWTKNILEFKAVRILVALGVAALAAAYLINYNSLEKKCERRVEKSSSYLPLSPSNKLQNVQLDVVKKQLIQECIKSNGTS